MTNASTKLLEVRNLAAGYGRKQVLTDVSLDIAAGEIVAIFGHNGAGKSTILKAIFGLVPVWGGSVVYDGQDQMAQPIPDRLRFGLVYLPQGHRVFDDLTVAEHLSLPQEVLRDSALLRQRVSIVLDWFPLLRTMLYRRARVLSGGEKQVLALAIAMIHKPRLLLLDEPLLGLAPPLVAEVMFRLSQLNRESATALLVVEQKVREVLSVASRAYVIRMGRVTYSGKATVLQQDPATLARAFL